MDDHFIQVDFGQRSFRLVWLDNGAPAGPEFVGSLAPAEDGETFSGVATATVGGDTHAMELGVHASSRMARTFARGKFQSDSLWLRVQAPGSDLVWDDQLPQEDAP